jgi:DNA helicase-2/ATP-dependent DNA helicase PcrA
MVVRLEQNYRSTAAIIDVANRLMRGRPGAVMLHAADRSSLVSVVEPCVVSYLSDVAEAQGVAQCVVAEIESGVKPENIAVLFRVNVQAAVCETVFSDIGVSYHIRGAKRFFDLPEVRQAIMALRAASVSIVGEPLFKSVSDVLRSLGWSSKPPDARGAVRDRWGSLNALINLVDQVAPGTTFRQFTDELMDRQASQHEPIMPAVTLATLHSAKGLEWDSVYVVGLSEGSVPISYASTFDQVDEERRLLYVGITRARQRLHLSWVSGESSGRGGRLPQRKVSRFLEEIGIRTAGGVGRSRGA